VLSHPSTATEIDAPLETVWSVMTDTDRYPEWNLFVVRIEREQPAQVDGGPTRYETVEEFSGPSCRWPGRLAWRRGSGGMRRP
jgi:hypothetical protein